MKELNDEFQELMDIIVIDNGVPNKVANLESLSTKILEKLERIIEIELMERLPRSFPFSEL